MSTLKVTESSDNTCRIVMQQCLKADLCFDTDDKPVSIEKGVAVFVCFLQGATPATASHVAKSILQAKLTEPNDEEETRGRKSCAELFPDCSLLLIPQATLGGKLKGKSVQYHGLVEKTVGSDLFSQLFDDIKKLLRDAGADETRVVTNVQRGVYGARQKLNMSTNGPFTHVFDFKV